jgi:hypothetical protein
MPLSEKNQVALVKEIRTVVDYMSKVNTPREKMYFFSAVFGIANRIMNQEFDPELGFIHHVTNSAYNTINTTLLLVAQGQSVPTFPPPVFDKLEEALKDLATYIEEGKRTYPVLERISNLAYSTSGNGYYLFLKGLLKIT